MRKMFRVTYEKYTPESLEDSDVSEQGFIEPDYGMEIPIAEALKDKNEYYMDLRTAMRHCKPSFDKGRWFSEESHTTDYQTGETKRCSIHFPDNITESSRQRLKRLMGVRW